MRTQHWIFAALITGLLLGAAGCREYRGLVFSHSLHAGEAGCADCHGGAARAGHDACRACHEIEDQAPSESCLSCHTKGDYRVESARPASYADVRFDHSPHEDQPCERCHAGASKSRKASDSNLPAMTACLACHDGDTAPKECATCHERIRREVRPPSHTPPWTRAHGDTSRSEESCGWCHARSACQDCHRTRRPGSHNATWKLSGHGREATHDREPCAACHRADECSRCHSTRPPSHFSPRFLNLASPDPSAQGHAQLVAQRGDRSCGVCHERSFCLTCHPAGY